MPSEETNRILDQIGDLKREIQTPDVDSRLRFEKAVEKLDRLSGATPEGTTFERVVWDLLSRDPDYVVSRRPHAAGSKYAPDFLVDVGGQKILIQAKALGTRDPAGYTRALEELAGAVAAYRADRALLVVPDDVALEGVEAPPDVEPVRISELHGALAA